MPLTPDTPTIASPNQFPFYSYTPESFQSKAYSAQPIPQSHSPVSEYELSLVGSRLSTKRAFADTALEDSYPITQPKRQAAVYNPSSILQQHLAWEYAPEGGNAPPNSSNTLVTAASEGPRQVNLRMEDDDKLHSVQLGSWPPHGKNGTKLSKDEIARLKQAFTEGISGIAKSFPHYANKPGSPVTSKMICYNVALDTWKNPSGADADFQITLYVNSNNKVQRCDVFDFSNCTMMHAVVSDVQAKRPDNSQSQMLKTSGSLSHSATTLPLHSTQIQPETKQPKELKPLALDIHARIDLASPIPIGLAVPEKLDVQLLDGSWRQLKRGLQTRVEIDEQPLTKQDEDVLRNVFNTGVRSPATSVLMQHQGTRLSENKEKISYNVVLDSKRDVALTPEYLVTIYASSGIMNSCEVYDMQTGRTTRAWFSSSTTSLQSHLPGDQISGPGTPPAAAFEWPENIDFQTDDSKLLIGFGTPILTKGAKDPALANEHLSHLHKAFTQGIRSIATAVTVQNRNKQLVTISYTVALDANADPKKNPDFSITVYASGDRATSCQVFNHTTKAVIQASILSTA